MQVDAVDEEIKQILDNVKSASDLFKNPEEKEYSPTVAHGNILETTRGWHAYSEWGDLVSVAIVQANTGVYLDFGYIHSYMDHTAGTMNHMYYCKKSAIMISAEDKARFEVFAYLPKHLARALINWRGLEPAKRVTLSIELEKKHNLHLEFLDK